MSSIFGSRVGGGISGLLSNIFNRNRGALNYSPTPATGTPPATAPTTPMPPVTPGYTAPSGFNIVSVGPGGIPTLRASSPTSTGSSSQQRLSQKLIAGR